MRKTLLLGMAVFIVGCGVRAQDAPLFTQKLTNSFLYNPSVAGNTFGSITLSHRKFWSGVKGSPNTNFISLHTPFGQHKFGTGINFYQDNVGITQALYGAAAFAYHIKITDTKLLSFGVSAEYNSLKIDMTKVDVVDSDDQLLEGGYASSGVDFSFGSSLKTKYFTIGAAANRLTALVAEDSVTQFPAFYSGFLQFTIPLAGDRDLLEPVFTVRSFANSSPQIDAGLFYTFNELATLGGSYRTGGAINATAALRIKNIMIGYSRDIFTGDLGEAIGSANEFTLRFDFRDESYYLRSRNARSINTQAMSIRRKTLSTYNHRGSSMKNNQRYKKQIKRHSYMSPNYRMSSSKKLMTKKRNGRKPAYRRKR
ncbi:MAG TPA: PorP/SprF family type IX secretion system membrane protein [Ohtaekwangia sp.]|nr:PorP/SprF family type IX secretion system membrane protein [Ohtaekwangia sp.]